MMSSEQTLLEEHLKETKEVFQSTLRRLRSLYLQEHYSHPDPWVPKFIELFLSTQAIVRVYVTGGHLDIVPYGMRYAVPYSPYEIMDWLTYFIGHELMDDGTPGLAYVRRLDCFTEYAWCDSTKEDAEPFFYKDVDDLRKRYPEAKWLSTQMAYETLLFHHTRQEEFIQNMVDVYDEDPRVPNPQEVLLTQFVEELRDLKKEYGDDKRRVGNEST